MTRQTNIELDAKNVALAAENARLPEQLNHIQAGVSQNRELDLKGHGTHYDGAILNAEWKDGIYDHVTQVTFFETKDRHTLRAQALESIAEYVVVLPCVISFTPCYHPTDLSSMDQIVVLLYSTSVTETQKAVNQNPYSILGLTFNIKSYNSIEVTGALSYPPCMTTSECEKVWPILQQAFRELPQTHSNLTAITAGYIYRSDQYEWDKVPHLLIHVSTIGYIPIGEKPFPKRFPDHDNGIPIKIMEGIYSSLVMSDTKSKACKPEDPIRPGMSIGMNSSKTSGTLGLFLSGPTNGSTSTKYILTNCHVVDSGDKKCIQQPSPQDLIAYEYRYGHVNQTQEYYNIGLVIEEKTFIGDIDMLVRSPIDATKTKEIIDKAFYGDHRMLVSSIRSPAKMETIKVGVDIGLCLFTSNRPTLPNPFFDVNDDYKCDFSTRVDEFNPFANVGNPTTNQIVKMGRSSDRTIGTPIKTTVMVVNKELGTYRVIRKHDNSLLYESEPPIKADRDNVKILVQQIELDAANYEIQKIKGLYITNQYLVESKNSPFAEPGDSGSICYIVDESSHNVRPWGLIHGLLKNTLISYAIVTPIEAVMQFLGQEYSFCV